MLAGRYIMNGASGLLFARELFGPQRRYPQSWSPWIVRLTELGWHLSRALILLHVLRNLPAVPRRVLERHHPQPPRLRLGPDEEPVHAPLLQLLHGVVQVVDPDGHLESPSRLARADGSRGDELRRGLDAQQVDDDVAELDGAAVGILEEHLGREDARVEGPAGGQVVGEEGDGREGGEGVQGCGGHGGGGGCSRGSRLLQWPSPGDDGVCILSAV
ncbi:Uncharacterized protein TCAP_01449, partial [Tolypocladium capitatum]